jgi:uncharacterized damage-inducible protein DinB
MEPELIFNEFKAQTSFRMDENIPRIEKCLNLLSEDEVWHKPNANLNSVGNLLLHLCGNITQYIISSLGGDPDKRLRDEEFEAKGGYTKAQLFDKISNTINKACEVINNASPEELMRVRSVQGFEYSGMGNVIHVAEHLSYHVGQIAFLTKVLTNKELGFYAGQDLNVKNKP